MIVTSIIAAPSKKMAISYDNKTSELVIQTCELIGLVQLENPDEEGDIQQVPCYMLCNNDGYFYVPELEQDFITYANPEDTLDMEALQPKIDAVKQFYKTTGVETVELETRGKITTIRRTLRKLDDDKSES